MIEILDELAESIKALTGRRDLLISGAYNNLTGKMLYVQINAHRTEIHLHTFDWICDLYGFRCRVTRDDRKRAHHTGRCIRYILAKNKKLIPDIN